MNLTNLDKKNKYNLLTYLIYLSPTKHSLLIFNIHNYKYNHRNRYIKI